MVKKIKIQPNNLNEKIIKIRKENDTFNYYRLLKVSNIARILYYSKSLVFFIKVFLKKCESVIAI
jgi:hypothetical protein